MFTQRAVNLANIVGIILWSSKEISTTSLEITIWAILIL